MSNNLEIIQKNLLDTLVYFDSFCTEHNLKYFIAYGTLLGAVRHKGFIPWDDDIDIFMPKNDYKKLISLSDSFKDPFSLKSLYTNEKCKHPYLKISNDNLILEEHAYKPQPSGVWLDVFPLDFAFDNLLLHKCHLLTVKSTRILFILKHGTFKTNKRSKIITNACKATHQIAKYIPQSIFKIAFDNLESFPSKFFKQRSNLVCIYSGYGFKEVSPASKYNKRALYEFEGYSFWGVEDADYILKKTYGDYNQLPPEHKRVPCHNVTVITSKE